MKASGGKKRARTGVVVSPKPPLASPHFTFDALCLPNAKPEYKFHATRKWRFDWVWKAAGVALEIEGGAWNYGRHNRAAGFLKDMEKYREAAIEGWCVIRVTPKELEEGVAADLVARALKLRGDCGW